MSDLKRSFVDLSLLAFAFYLCGAAAFSGYFAKWALRDGDARYDAVAVLDGTAVQPFAYRQLVPALANAVNDGLPASVQERLSDALMERNWLGRDYGRATQSGERSHILRYYLMYGFAFAGALASLFLLRRLALDLTGCPVTAAVAAPLFVLAMTLMETGGGYYYDWVELPCMVAAVLLARRARFAWLSLVVAVAVLNKESFLFFALALYPLLPRRVATAQRVAWTAAYLAICAVVNAAFKLHYADNGGGMVVVHLVDNLREIATPAGYFIAEISYGLPFPSGFNVLNIAIVAVLAVRGWPQVPADLKRHVALAALFNLPLFLAFAVLHELRNLSFLYVGLFAVLACALRQWVMSAAHEDRPQREPSR